MILRPLRKTLYFLVCNVCRKFFNSEPYNHASRILEDSTNAGWRSLGNNTHVCPDCEERVDYIEKN